MQRNRSNLVGALPEWEVETELEEHHRRCCFFANFQLECFIHSPSMALAYCPRMRGSKGRRHKITSFPNCLTAGPP